MSVHMTVKRFDPFLSKCARQLWLGGLAVLASFLWVLSIQASVRIYPTGVTTYDPARAYNCYVVFDTQDEKTHLIDMDGNEVHQWAYPGAPSVVLDPKLTGGKLGHVVVKLEGMGAPRSRSFWITKTLAELDWEGNVVWKWGDKAPGGAAQQNHDWDRLPNGDTLVVSGLVAGLLDPFPGFSPVQGGPAIYEVSPSGDIVWTWLTSEHIEELGLSPEGLALIRKRLLHAGGQGVAGGLLTINAMRPLGPNRWFEGGDARFNPDNLLINSPDGNFTAIIEKKTGKIVWRLGPDYPGHEFPENELVSTQVPRPVDLMTGQHDANLIHEGLPGAGNILVFDNQGEGDASRVLEIDPIKKEIVWWYTGEDSDRSPWTFWSSFISSARRLPNGNTLIDEGMNGRFFQVTPKGDIVWEYVNPYFGRETHFGRAVLTNWVYRALPVPYDWVPAGTPRSEKPVVPPDVSKFHVPANN